MPLLLLMWSTLLAGCAISTPYRELAVPAGGRALVSATHVRLAPGTRARFREQADRVVDSLAAQPGLLGYSLRRHLWHDEFWTYTVWRDEASRAAFLARGQHRDAMAKAGDTLAWARYANFEVDAARLPPRWADVLERVAGPEGGGASPGSAPGKAPGPASR